MTVKSRWESIQVQGANSFDKVKVFRLRLGCSSSRCEKLLQSLFSQNCNCSIDCGVDFSFRDFGATMCAYNILTRFADLPIHSLHMAK